LSLDHEEHRVCRYGVLKVRASRARQARSRLEGGLSQLSSASRTRSTLFPGEPDLRTPKHRQSRAPAGVRAPASLERR